MSEQVKFKDYFDEKLAERLAHDIQVHYPAFDTSAFVAFVAERVPPLELKARVATIADGLQKYLPSHYPNALSILYATFGEELAAEAGMFDTGYHLMPIAYFVEVYGLEHPELSVAAAYEITKRFSSEFAIRPYIAQHTEYTMARLQEWADDPNPHVRRLVSEGTRTRLPWASQLPQFMKDPSPVLELLTILRDDESAYVRKSVANNLNDISKDHPQLVINTLRNWLIETTPHREWIAKHALRTLIKAGNRDALDLLGFAAPKLKSVQLEITPPEIQLGEAITLSVAIESHSTMPQALMLDYVIHFVRANDKRNEKVFKLKSVTLEPGNTLRIEKVHTIKPVTVRRYYAGKHEVELQINGERVAASMFVLRA